jgi:hypothetical protein
VTLDLSTIRLVAPHIVAVQANGERFQAGLSQVRFFFENGMVGKVCRRGTGCHGAIRRIELLAMPGEMAHYSPRQSVKQVLPTTYTHRASLAKGL